jgi:hypothetical protein
LGRLKVDRSNYWLYKLSIDRNALDDFHLFRINLELWK